MIGSEKFTERGDTVNRALVSGDLVMGLRWDTHEASFGQPARRANLDAACLLLDIENRWVELIYPGDTRSRNDSVLHTGDSTTGTSSWDDERIFVFLDAVPDVVATLAFMVRSEADQVFGDVRTASWHVSDSATERVYLQADLAPYGYSTVRCVAVLRRRPDGWHILDRTEAGPVAVAAESLMLGIEERA